MPKSRPNLGFYTGSRRDLYGEFLRVPSGDVTAFGYWLWCSLFNAEIPCRGCIRVLVRVGVQCAKPWERIASSGFRVGKGGSNPQRHTPEPDRSAEAPSPSIMTDDR